MHLIDFVETQDLTSLYRVIFSYYYCPVGVSVFMFRLDY